MKDYQKENKDRILKDLELLRNNEELRKTLLYLKEQSESNINGFEKSKKRLKNLLKQEGLIVPDIDNIFEILFYWRQNSDQDSDIRKYFESLPQDKFRLESIPTDIIYIWSKEETERIKKEIKKAENSEKGEALAVKYQLLDEFLKGNEQFEKLLIKDREILLGYILGGRADTIRHIKNNMKKRPDGKHITEKSYERFLDLLEKIKKGDIL